jgi:hypothetical protein
VDLSAGSGPAAAAVPCFGKRLSHERQVLDFSPLHTDLYSSQWKGTVQGTSISSAASGASLTRAIEAAFASDTAASVLAKPHGPASQYDTLRRVTPVSLMGLRGDAPQYPNYTSFLRATAVPAQ